MTTSGWQIQTQLLSWWKPDGYNAIPKTTHPIPSVPALYWLLDKWPAAPHTPLFSSIHLTHTAANGTLFLTRGGHLGTTSRHLRRRHPASWLAGI